MSHQFDDEATRVSQIVDLKSLLAKNKRDRAYLVVLAGSNVGEMYKLEEAEILIGRASNAGIRLNDEGVSRRHARIVKDADSIVVEDLQSANGTLVNGEPVARRVLVDGDKVMLGSTSVLRFGYHDEVDESFQQQMFDAALRDGMTGAYNKKFFTDRLESELAYAKRHNTHLSLLLFDVDHFKRVNDTYGHLAGDQVLVQLSKLTQGTIRTEDVFARYGGEEFAVYCRAVPLETAGIVGERLRSLVENHHFMHEGQRLPVTISIGVAAFPITPANAGPELVAAADEALYEAKRCGRNRVLLRRSA
jgi:two-component system cell cycle response regulator